VSENSQLNRSRNLSATELQVLISCIYIMAEKKRDYVYVKEVAEFIGRDASTARAFLNKLKKKGYVRDIDPRHIERKSRFEILAREAKLGGNMEGEAVSAAPRGGVEKGWMIVKYNMPTEEGIISFIEDHREEIKTILRMDPDKLQRILLEVLNRGHE